MVSQGEAFDDPDFDLDFMAVSCRDIPDACVEKKIVPSALDSIIDGDPWADIPNELMEPDIFFANHPMVNSNPPHGPEDLSQALIIYTGRFFVEPPVVSALTAQASEEDECLTATV